MEEQIYELIAEISENDIEDIKEDSDILEDLQMDSLMLIDLVVKLEVIVGKSIDPKKIGKLKKVNDILNLV